MCEKGAGLPGPNIQNIAYFQLCLNVYTSNTTPKKPQTEPDRVSTASLIDAYGNIVAPPPGLKRSSMLSGIQSKLNIFTSTLLCDEVARGKNKSQPLMKCSCYVNTCITDSIVLITLPGHIFSSPSALPPGRAGVNGGPLKPRR